MATTAATPDNTTQFVASLTEEASTPVVAQRWVYFFDESIKDYVLGWIVSWTLDEARFNAMPYHLVARVIMLPSQTSLSWRRTGRALVQAPVENIVWLNEPNTLYRAPTTVINLATCGNEFRFEEDFAYRPSRFGAIASAAHRCQSSVLHRAMARLTMRRNAQRIALRVKAAIAKAPQPQPPSDMKKLAIANLLSDDTDEAWGMAARHLGWLGRRTDVS